MRAGVILRIPYLIFILLRAASKKVRIRSTERQARPAQRYRASQQLDLVINRHFFRLHHLAFNLAHRQPGIA